MTRVNDIKQLIAEEAPATAERRALEEMANRLEDTLGTDVPYRPEFKTQLRKRLIAQARPRLTPWYRRSAFVGSGMAVAAAAAVLVVGLRIWTGGEAEPLPPPEATQPPPVAIASDPPTPSVVSKVSLPEDLRQIQLADEKVSAASPNPNFARNVEAAQGLQVKLLTARPSEEQLRAMAARLAVQGESHRTSAGWEVSEENRSLTLSAEGQVGYSDTAPRASADAATVSADSARQAAYQFLDKALLPVPGQPVVTAEPTGFNVVYTEQVEGRPVVNARTVVTVSSRGAVVRAEAYVSSGTMTELTSTAIVTEAEAVAEANSQGGSFDRADLVWVRTPGEGTVYLQPYWRVFGTDSSSTPIVRYVPALKR